MDDKKEFPGDGFTDCHNLKAPAVPGTSINLKRNVSTCGAECFPELPSEEFDRIPDNNESSGKDFEIGHEADPSGKAQHTPGAKLDSGKVRPGLVFSGFPRALWEVSRVGTFGAVKYSEFGFLEVENGEARYCDAQMRHFLKNAMGEEIDSDSQCLHLAAEAWNALAKLEFFLREKENETR